ncbi:MAG: hypothetical protein SAqPseu_21300 [Shewanella algae]
MASMGNTVNHEGKTMTFTSLLSFTKQNSYKNSQPDIVRVTQYVLDHGKNGFSVLSASNSKELNGIGVHTVATVLRSICLDLWEGHLEFNTKVDSTYSHASYVKWELTPQAYNDHISHRSLLMSKWSLWATLLALLVAIGS